MPVRTATSDAVLRGALETALAERGLARPGEIRRRPFEYATSFPLERLELRLDDGTELHLLCKQLSWSGLDEKARLAKPRFLHDPRREPAVYAEVLAPRGLGPRYYGSAVEAEVECCWLFVERVEGRELYQVGEPELWLAAAKWLAQTHRALAGEIDRLASRARLLEYDETYYRRWIERACEFAATAGRNDRARAMAWLAERYDPVVEGLLDLPHTFLHGEFYASNVIVAGDAPAPRVCPVDWEMAARGPGLVDLAALVSGDWTADEREAIAAAYGEVAGGVSGEQLDLARLHLAVQWLGWAPPEWVPPEGQRHDWLGEAIGLAEGLGL